MIRSVCRIFRKGGGSKAKKTDQQNKSLLRLNLKLSKDHNLDRGGGVGFDPNPTLSGHAPDDLIGLGLVLDYDLISLGLALDYYLINFRLALNYDLISLGLALNYYLINFRLALDYDLISLGLALDYYLIHLRLALDYDLILD